MLELAAPRGPAGLSRAGDPLTRRSPAPAARAPDVRVRVELIHARAVAAANRGRYDLSRRQAEAGLRLLPGRTAAEDAAGRDGAAGAEAADPSLSRLEVRLLTLLAAMEQEIFGQGAGLPRLEEAAARAVTLGADDLTFAVRQARALRALRVGARDEALAQFTLADALADAATDLDVCRMLVNRGTVRLERLDLEGAREDFERCLVRAGSKPDLQKFAAMARHNLGYTEFLAGDLPTALRLMREALLGSEETTLATSLLDLARVLTEAGLIDEADTALRRAADAARRGRAWAWVAEIELSGAQLALLTGRFDLARRLAGSARNRFRRRGNEAWRRRAELVLLAGDLADGRPASLLVAPALRLAEEFTAEGLTPYATTARLVAAEALLRAGRPAEAERAYAALPRPSRTDVLEVRLQRRTVAGQLERALGDPAAAAREVRLGLEDLARYQARFGSVDLQTASALHGRRLAALDLDLALSGGRPAAVFAALERGRERSRRLVPVTPPSGSSAPLLVELRQLTTTLHEIGADPDHRAEAQRVRQRVADVTEELRGLSWQVGGLPPVGTATPLVEVRERLAACVRQMLLLGRHGDELVVVVLGRARPRLVRLAGVAARASALTRTVRADLDVVARPRLPERLRASASASARHKLAALDALLLGGLGLGDGPLVVVPTADLSTLPWGCLPSLRGRPVEVAPTAGAWWRRSEPPSARPREARVVAVAGPDVPAALREVEQVAATWPGAGVLHGASATREAFTDRASRATLAHLATHGHHVAQSPLFSSFDLADGPLFAYELEAGQVPDHVVLSACELGQATVRPGEESLGLTSVLLQLGARCVVSGVAEVGDEVAAEVMVGYHRRLAEGSDSAVALADAAAATDQPVPFTCFGAAVRFAGSAAAG
ncbi:CHAT domain-containing protein [Microlunatus flavus]|uniref:CHAT domain-containing protein n=1 Tax=Microlunatus flavus TaxID=1036181 RepID=A0A1H9DFV7_9ACTN|nr:CHAT domain-containing protein [Microlunatus flavus]SEQ11618.1 CHAT domain-containing protein [Microlunatus flavus]